MLRMLPPIVDPNLLVGPETSDDAAVYRLTDELALVLTVDYFTPIVDDPRAFGQIAAANALSDVYAMNARPVAMLSIVGFPRDKLPMTLLGEILQGGAEKAREAGINVVGGHSIDDAEPKVGYAVVGLVHPERIWRNVGARPGDALVLTKPLGTGIISTAIKQGKAPEHVVTAAVRTMARLNRAAAEAAATVPVHAATDVTGLRASRAPPGDDAEARRSARGSTRRRSPCSRVSCHSPRRGSSRAGPSGISRRWPRRCDGTPAFPRRFAP